MTPHSQLAEIAGRSYRGPQSGRVALDVRVDFVPHGDEIVVTMPGTHPADPLDWARDLFALPVWIAGLGLVHAGFGQGALAAWAYIDAQMRRDALATYTMHSLGGAMGVGVAALHALHRPQQPFRLVTFAAPRIGFGWPWLRARLGAALEAVQYVRAGDLVPHVPTRPYLHGAPPTRIGVSAGNPILDHQIARYAADCRALGR